MAITTPITKVLIKTSVLRTALPIAPVVPKRKPIESNSLEKSAELGPLRGQPNPSTCLAPKTAREIEAQEYTFFVMRGANFRTKQILRFRKNSLPAI